MNVHQGHRQRIKDWFLAGGLKDFPETTALELILFFAVPQGDTNVTAHELMNAFGDLSSVMDAPFEELVKVKGVNRHTATLLKLIPEAARRYQISRASTEQVVANSTDAGKHILPYYLGEKDEIIYLMSLDSKSRIINVELVSRGSLSSASMNVRKIAERALVNNAAAVILFHNHVAGVALPSGEDIACTDRLYDALRRVDVVLHDHIIVAEDDFVSMRESHSCFCWKR